MSSSRQQENRNIGMYEILPQFSPWIHSRSKIYSDFFNPNICHICKRDPKSSRAHFEDFNTCRSCNMILYCSSNHELEHKANHEEICIILGKLSHSHPVFWQTHNFRREDWVKSRKDLLRIVKVELQRYMKPYEVPMIMFAKSCFICHEQRNLQTCTECYCVNYCSNHAEVLIYHHITNCAKLKSCLGTDKYIQSTSLSYFRFTQANSVTIHNVVNMQQFIETFMNYKSDHLKKFYSDYLSGPLTLYHGIMNYHLHVKDIQNEHYVIHIIVANNLDAQYILAWEIMLHMFSGELKHLEVILIGSEMQTIRVNVNLCSICTLCQKKFEVQSYRLHLRDYANMILSCNSPNVIIAFEADFSDWDLGAEIISKLKSQSCPFVVTAGSKSKFEKNRQELNKILRTTLDLTPIENKFSSLRAYRNLEDDDVFYRNKFLVIFKGLKNLFNSHNEPE
ncbi:hypothetical protein EAI_15932 [Harpegnathos saltator]|uniref:MYND-type domain-containing protein n=1 Tax=Harpegnathos saltator TaxID=610380 RepID=E2B570_HARSA|nr:hypothetical protein EAI_15932 [Harpegnathos saltator]